MPPVELDDLATEVATKHAVDLVTNDFIGHWGTDGLKPYHRYAAAGGTHATEENVSAVDGTWSTKAKDLKLETAYLHVRLYQEKPPYDGHRRTILRPQHTHVGIGLAVQSLRLRMVELFVAKYVDVQPIKCEAKPGAQLSANYAVPAATVAQSLGRLPSGNVTNVTINLVAPGSMYGDRLNDLDFRVAKILKLGRTRTTVGVDLYNVLNSSAVLNSNQTFIPNGSWLRPTLVLTSRFAKISATVDF